jgi:hypothetical protein
LNFRVGPINALKLMKEYGTIETILSAKHPKYFPDATERQTYLQGVANARAIFSNPPPPPDSAGLTMQKTAADLDSLLKGFGIVPGFGGSDFFGESLGDDPRARDLS